MNEYYRFEVQPLGYAYDALEPYIDSRTMQLHHDKHYGGYVDRLNKVLEENPEYQKYSLFELVANYRLLPSNVREPIRNFGGGVYTHKMFFDLMTPGGGKEPFGNVLKAIVKSFGSYEEFKRRFREMAVSKFGSGWIWLVIGRNGSLELMLTSNADTPLADNLYPVLLLDLWEHAYYLKYQNRRNEYIDAWLNVINWSRVEEWYNMYEK